MFFGRDAVRVYSEVRQREKSGAGVRHSPDEMWFWRFCSSVRRGFSSWALAPGDNFSGVDMMVRAGRGEREDDQLNDATRMLEIKSVTTRINKIGG